MQRALDDVRPYLGSHGGDVAPARGHRRGCRPAGAARQLRRLRIVRGHARARGRGRVRAAAPEVVRIEVEEKTPSVAGLISVDSLTARLRADGAVTAAGVGVHWAPAARLDELAVGGVLPDHRRGTDLVLLRLLSGVYAYRDACAGCGATLRRRRPAARASRPRAARCSPAAGAARTSTYAGPGPTSTSRTGTSTRSRCSSATVSSRSPSGRRCRHERGRRGRGRPRRVRWRCWPGSAAGRPDPPPYERCEMCGAPVADAHQHVVNVGNRSLLCACRPCYLLFTHDDADARLPGGARPLPVLPGPRCAGVGGARAAGRHRLPVPQLRPGPGGRVLPRSGRRDRVRAAARRVGRASSPRPRGWRPSSPTSRRSWCAPPASGSRRSWCRSTSATSWSGHLRTLWRGFDGGQDVRRRLDEFFDTVRSRSRPATTQQPVGRP